MNLKQLFGRQQDYICSTLMALCALQIAEGKSSAGIRSCLSPFNFSNRAAALRLLNNSSVNFSKFLFSSVAGTCGGFEDVPSKETACSCEEIHFWGGESDEKSEKKHQTFMHNFKQWAERSCELRGELQKSFGLSVFFFFSCFGQRILQLH